MELLRHVVQSTSRGLLVQRNIWGKPRINGHKRKLVQEYS